jgi:hypothetical protein
LDQLEAPADIGALYMARGEEVETLRPLMHGDVFKETTIPGIDDGLGLAVVLTHPCAMRTRDGVLVPRLLLGRVVEHQRLPPHRWPDGWYGVMPLPELRSHKESLALDFEQIGTVKTADLVVSRRIAYLSEYGASVMLQRILNHFSRVVVSVSLIHQQAAPNFEEADLLHEWLDALVQDASSPGQIIEQTREFNDFLNGNTKELRNMLLDAVNRSTVRKRVRAEIQTRKDLTTQPANGT